MCQNAAFLCPVVKCEAVACSADDNEGKEEFLIVEIGRGGKGCLGKWKKKEENYIFPSSIHLKSLVSQSR